MKKVSLASMDTRVFITELIKLVEMGAKFTDECIALRKPILSVELMLNEETLIEPSPYLRIVPYNKKEEVEKAKIVPPKATKTARARKQTNKLQKPQEPQEQKVETELIKEEVKDQEE